MSFWSQRREQQEVFNVNGTPSQHQQDQHSTGESLFVSAPPIIDLDSTEEDDDDDDLVESTAAAFNEAKRNNSRREHLVSDAASVYTTKVLEHRQMLRSYVELNSSIKSKATEVAAPVDEPKFNCPICLYPFTEETSTKCGHIFCKSCIKKAISRQAKCPTCRQKVTARGLIRVFLPNTI